MFLKISNASINFNESGTPVASAFDDVYFSNESGIQETQFVFIDSNHLNERWLKTTQSSFHIGETGFGTGLNFLVAAQQFMSFRKNNPTSPLHQLYFLSTEKFPLTKLDLRKALTLWPELSILSDAFIKQYPMALPGLHRIHLFNNQVVLDLWLGDATEGFTHAHAHNEGRIDAWFLDGFAPSKNDSMWQPALFNQIKRLSKDHATFATFTAAGAVKRGLRDAGFTVRKQKGFGKKREMLIGNLTFTEDEKISTRQAPINHRHTSKSIHQTSTKQHVAIVGGGIAAAICALKLIKMGKKVSLYCADDRLAQGASGNEQGGFYPQLNAAAGIASQIHAHSFLYARQFYDQLLSEGHFFEHQWCGVLQLCFNENVTNRYQNMMRNQTWPQALVEWLEPEQASTIANMQIPTPGLHLPLGGWLSPPSLVEACINAAGGDDFSIYVNHRLQNMVTIDNKPQLTFNCVHNDAVNKTSESVKAEADIVVLACGAESHLLQDLDLPFRMTRGQVERIPSNSSISPLSTVLCHKGYMTPAHQNHHAMGSTYIKSDLNTEYRESEAELNLNMHQQALSDASWSHDLILNNSANTHNSKHHSLNSDPRGRAAIRCSLPDHLPVVGAFPLVETQKIELNELYKAKADNCYPTPSVQPNVYLLTGLGSRGLTTAPLMAEILVSQLCSAPLPLDNRLLNALNPNRFLIRDLIRRR